MIYGIQNVETKCLYVKSFLETFDSRHHLRWGGGGVGGAVNNSKGLHSVPAGAPFNYHFNLRIYENVHAECLP